MASEIRVNRLSNRSGLSTITFANGGVQFSGITTFANGDFRVGTGATILNPSTNEMQFHTGGSSRLTINNSGATIGALTATTGTFSSNVSIGGVLTYEDVKNVDAIGIVTARTGAEINGGDLKVGTAVTFSAVTGNVTQDVGITTFSGSAVWFKGATANKDMYWSKSSGATVYKDNAQILMGDSSDLQLYHSGSHSFIKDAGTGGIKVMGSDIYIKNVSDADMIHAQSGGPVKLYNAGNLKLETTSSGVTVTGDMNISDGTGQSHYQITQTNGNTVKFGIVSGSDIELSGSSNNSMYFKTNNTERVRITAAGYMGINTDSPVRPLHIVGNDGSSGATSGNSDTTLVLENAGGNGSMIEFMNATDGAGHLMFTDADTSNRGRISYHHNGDYFRFDTSGSERLRITSGGDVTIGNSSVAFPSGGGLQVYNASAPRIKLTNSTTGVASGDGLQIYVSGSSAIFDQKENAEMRFYTNGTERLRIDSSGNMGLGTGSGIDRQLHIQGSAPIIKLEDTGGGYSEISANTAVLSLRADQGNTQSSSYINFQVDGTERLRITSAGLLLLGTTDTGFSTGYTNMTIGNTSTANTGLTIASSSSNGYSRLHFADGNSGAARYAGWIAYNHADDEMMFSTGNNGSAKITIGTGSNTITGGTNLAIQNLKVKGIWSGTPSIGKEIELISGYDGSVKMAAIGYNLTDTGTGSTYGGDLVFHTQPLYSSPTTPIPETMRISSSGYITKTKQPRAHVLISTQTQLGNSKITAWASPTINVSSFWDSTNKRFVAPCAGVYMFGGNFRIGAPGHVRVVKFNLQIYNSGGTHYATYGGGVGGAHNYDDSSSGWDHPYVSFTNMIQLSKADYVELHTSELAVQHTSYIQTNNNQSGMWGFLLM